jgi:hypothetical protein
MLVAALFLNASTIVSSARGGFGIGALGRFV